MDPIVYNFSPSVTSSADWSHQHLDRKEFNNWKQAKVLDLAPVIVLDVLFMLFGVVGNSIVCYICYFRLPRNVINSFVMALALLELLGCVFTIPVDITEIINSFSFNFSVLCKIERYIRKFVVFSSGCVLVAIATERYKRIVTPYSRHVTMAEFRAAIFGALMVSALLSVPEAILAGNETVQTPYGKGTVCSTYSSDAYRHNTLPKLWGLTCVLIYVASATSIGAIYFVIASKIWKRGKVKTDQRSRVNTPDSTLQRRVVRTHPQENLNRKTPACNVYFTYSPKYANNNNNGQLKRNPLSSTSLHSDKIRTLPREASDKVNSIPPTGFINEPNPSAKAAGTFRDEERPYTFSVVVESRDSADEEVSAVGFAHYPQRRARHSDVHPQHRSRSTVFLEEIVRSLNHRTHRRQAGHCHDGAQKSCPLDPVHPLQPLTPMGSLRRRPGYSRKRTTFIMFIMTLTTVLSHLPHITVMLYKLTHPAVDVSLQPDIHVMFKIMWNSYFISLASHPFVYGFWNGRFKHALFALFTGFSRSRQRLREQRESCSSNRHS
ncbi:hypothetical protein Btru_050948 [Bulinus truncatus]|nr:hypothetical protein Btru_050948 [Bulinus truncatus]